MSKELRKLLTSHFSSGSHRSELRDEVVELLNNEEKSIEEILKKIISRIESTYRGVFGSDDIDEPSQNKLSGYFLQAKRLINAL